MPCVNWRSVVFIIVFLYWENNTLTEALKRMEILNKSRWWCDDRSVEWMSQRMRTVLGECYSYDYMNIVAILALIACIGCFVSHSHPLTCNSSCSWSYASSVGCQVIIIYVITSFKNGIDILILSLFTQVNSRGTTETPCLISCHIFFYFKSHEYDDSDGVNDAVGFCLCYKQREYHTLQIEREPYSCSHYF